MRIPHMRLTILLRNGVILPSLTAPCSRRMNVAYVRKVPNPAPTIIAVKFNNYSGRKYVNRMGGLLDMTIQEADFFL